MDLAASLRFSEESAILCFYPELWNKKFFLLIKHYAMRTYWGVLTEVSGQLHVLTALTPVLIRETAGWAPEPASSLWIREKCIVLPEVEPWLCSPLLYRLRYPGWLWNETHGLNLCFYMMFMERDRQSDTEIAAGGWRWHLTVAD
jgi:hypothetical protein